jgi:hypothetical protein
MLTAVARSRRSRVRTDDEPQEEEEKDEQPGGIVQPAERTVPVPRREDEQKNGRNDDQTTQQAIGEAIREHRRPHAEARLPVDEGRKQDPDSLARRPAKLNGGPATVEIDSGLTVQEDSMKGTRNSR